MSHIHIVEAGDCLSSIAKKYRFSKWQTIYRHPDNADFRKKRPNPNLINPGDELVIPDREFKYHECATDQRHEFLKKKQTTLLSIIVEDASGRPLAGSPYKLTVNTRREPYEGTVGHNGLVEVSIAADASEGELTVFACGGGQTWLLALGHLDPVEEHTGVVGRLRNLAYDVSRGTSPQELANVLKCFQCDHQLEPTGKLDDETRDVLVAIHDNAAQEAFA